MGEQKGAEVQSESSGNLAQRSRSVFAKKASINAKLSLYGPPNGSRIKEELGRWEKAAVLKPPQQSELKFPGNVINS